MTEQELTTLRLLVTERITTLHQHRDEFGFDVHDELKELESISGKLRSANE